MSAELTEAEREALADASWKLGRKGWEAEICNIIDARLATVEAERDQAYRELAIVEADARYFEQQLADLRAGITALADDWQPTADLGGWHVFIGELRALRALLDTPTTEAP